MAQRKPRPSAKPPTRAVTGVPPSRAAKRDIRPFIYYGLGQALVIGYACVIVYVIPNRLPSAQAQLWTIPIFTQVMAAGMICVVWSPARKAGWWTSVIGGSLLLLSTIVLILRILVSAAFLAGVYGAFGKAAAMFAVISVALVIELVALLPIVQIKYLMSRSGRQVFGVG